MIATFVKNVDYNFFHLILFGQFDNQQWMSIRICEQYLKLCLKYCYNFNHVK